MIKLPYAPLRRQQPASPNRKVVVCIPREQLNWRAREKYPHTQAFAFTFHEPAPTPDVGECGFIVVRRDACVIRVHSIVPIPVYSHTEVTETAILSIEEPYSVPPELVAGFLNDPAWCEGAHVIPRKKRFR